MAQTVEATEEFVATGRFAHLIGVNADKLLQMRDMPTMDAIVRRCEIVNADGASMVMAAKILGVDIEERVAGVDLMWELCGLAERNGHSIYLLGAQPEVVDKAADVLSSHYPALRISGLHDGYFSEQQFDSVISEVSSASPDIVFVGITSPKKELLIERFRKAGVVGVFVGVGGSFDVVSGKIARAPRWVQKANLEWFFRMTKEPKRLLRRYVVGNARFCRLLFGELRNSRRRHV